MAAFSDPLPYNPERPAVMAFAKRTPMHLQCPLCRSPLHLHAASRGVYCDNKHHFDPAPEGYLDLIPGKKNPKDSDSRACCAPSAASWNKATNCLWWTPWRTCSLLLASASLSTSAVAGVLLPRPG